MSAAEKLTSDILKYLLSHPDAEDTLDGIARFWVARQEIEVRIEQTKIALNDLVNKGYLKVHKHQELGTSGATFCLDQSKLTEILGLLSTQGDREPDDTNPSRGFF